MRSVALACALALPLPFLAAGAGSLAERLGRELGRSLSGVADQFAAQRHAPAPLTLIAPLAEAEPVEAPRPRAMKRAPAPAAKKGVYVRANAVLRLARVGARPSGVPVRATADRPAGLALVGVSGLGVGLSDGDILTHAGGVPARSPGQVVGLVISARGARAGHISGRFWRRGEYYDLVVEQPYLKPKPSAPDT